MELSLHGSQVNLCRFSLGSVIWQKCCVLFVNKHCEMWKIGLSRVERVRNKAMEGKRENENFYPIFSLNCLVFTCVTRGKASGRVFAGKVFHCFVKFIEKF